MWLDLAYKEYDVAYELLSESGEKLLDIRQSCIPLINNVENLINSISKTPKSFEIDIQEVKTEREKFKDTVEFGKEQQKALEKSAIDIGVGVTVGTGVASLAPTAAMWVATTFGTASTGTAISALSGAAASNAALAWLGGGALAAGGSGMAAGNALLALAGPIGWGVAGASLAASLWLLFKKKNKINEDKKNEISRIKNCTTSLKETKASVDAIILESQSLHRELNQSYKKCKDYQGCNYIELEEEEKLQLGAIVNNTKSLSFLLNKTV